MAPELPFEGLSNGLVVVLELQQALLQAEQIIAFIGAEHLALDDGEVHLDLVEPTGVDRRGDLEGVAVPVAQALGGGRAAMSRGRR